MNRLAATKAKHELPQPKGEFVMARKSYQKGSLEWKGDRPTLRFWERVSVNPEKWVHRRFDLDEILKGERNEKRIQSAIDQKMAAINASNNGVIVSMPTVQAFVEHDWQMYLKSSGKDVKRSSRTTRDNLIKRYIIGTFGQQPLDQVTVSQMTAFFATLSDTYASSYVLNIYNYCKQVFEAAVEMEILSRSPVRKTLHRPIVNRSKKPQLTADEIRNLFNCFDDDFKVLMLVIAVASLRIGEVLALWWEDFDAERSSLNVRHTLWKTERGTTKTESSSATLHLPTAVTNALRAHRACSANIEPTDYIFCWPDGRPYYEEYLLDKVLYPALKKAGIKRQRYATGFHLFRRSCGKLLYELTHDAKMVQEYLRHSVISTTMDVYVGRVDSVREEATEMMAKKLDFPLFVPFESDLVQ